jgi:hypothetical protein
LAFKNARDPAELASINLLPLPPIFSEALTDDEIAASAVASATRAVPFGIEITVDWAMIAPNAPADARVDCSSTDNEFEYIRKARAAATILLCPLLSLKLRIREEILL